MAVDQSERTAKQVDPRRDDGRADAIVVEDERLDEVIEMALVIRDVHHPSGARRLLGDVDVFVDAIDLAEDRIERMFQRAVDGIALGGA